MCKTFLGSTILIIGFCCVSISMVRGAPAESGEGENQNAITLKLKGLKDELESLTLLLRQLQQKLASAEAEAAAVAASVNEPTTEPSKESTVDDAPVNSLNTPEQVTMPTIADPTTTTESDPNTVSPSQSTDSVDQPTEPAITDPVTTSTSTSSTSDPVTATTSSSTVDPVVTTSSSTSSTPDPVTNTTSSATVADPVVTTSSATSESISSTTTSTLEPLPSSSSTTDAAATSTSTSDPTTSSSSTPDPIPASESTSPAVVPTQPPPVTSTSAKLDDSASTPKEDIEENDLPQPMTRLYSGPNLTGMHEDFNFEGEDPSKCIQIKKLSPSSIKSLDTFGTCVRLFQLPDCEGQSMAYYPMTKSGTPEDQMRRDSFLQTTHSVGRCLENELEGAQTEKKPDGTRAYRKLEGDDNKPLIPDLIPLGDDNSLTPVPNGGPIKKCRLGYKNRVEAIKADVTPRELQNMAPPNFSKEDQQFYAQMDKREGDQMGQFIGTRFGPPPQGLPFRNCFAQTQRNREMMQRMEGQAANWLTAGGNNERRVLTIRIFVDYGLANSTRPVGMTCVMNGGGGGARFRRMAYLSNLPPIVRSPLPFRIITTNAAPFPPPYFRIVVPNYNILT